MIETFAVATIEQDRRPRPARGHVDRRTRLPRPRLRQAGDGRTAQGRRTVAGLRRRRGPAPRASASRLVLLGLLRLLQAEWDRAASGSLSWLAVPHRPRRLRAVDRAHGQPDQQAEPQQGGRVMAKAAPATGPRITRDDLEQRFSALQGDLKGKVASRKQTLGHRRQRRRRRVVADRLPARQAQRQAQDDAGRDPQGVTDADETRAAGRGALLAADLFAGRPTADGTPAARRVDGPGGRSTRRSSPCVCCARCSASGPSWSAWRSSSRASSCASRRSTRAR